MAPSWIRPLFLVAALFDIVLGTAYLLAYPALYAYFGVELPNHPGYVQLNALFVIVMGVGFWMVANAPVRNRDLVRLGVLSKVAFAAIVLLDFARGTMPPVWVMWAVCELLFVVAFVAALRALPPAGEARA